MMLCHCASRPDRKLQRRPFRVESARAIVTRETIRRGSDVVLIAVLSAAALLRNGHDHFRKGSELMTAMLWERRKFFRIPITGKALVQHGERLDGLYHLHDLSIGGCMLMHGPACSIGERVGVTLHVDGQSEIELPAKVVRHVFAPDGEHVGLCFTDQDPLFEDSVQDLVMRSIEREQQTEILMVHAHPERVTPLFDTMRAIGQSIVLARTPREALEILERGAERVRLAIVAPVVGASNSRDIVKLIMRRFPHVNCVMLSRGGAGRLVRAIRSAVPEEDRDSHSAWSLTHLRKVIGKHELIMMSSV
jgi:hypothetical protein